MLLFLFVRRPNIVRGCIYGRGHPYTVGNCGMPMQETRCSAPGCGALIGGHNHKSSAGNTRVGGAFNVAPKQSSSTRSFRGYRPEETEHYEVLATNVTCLEYDLPQWRFV